MTTTSGAKYASRSEAICFTTEEADWDVIELADALKADVVLA